MIKGCSIKAKLPKDMMLGREGRVESGGAEEIEGDEDLQVNLVP